MPARAHVKVYSSSIPVGVWSGGLALVAIAALLIWALPQARVLVAIGFVAGGLLALGLVLMRRRAAGRPDESSAPLHLRV
jgi:hypothetical protein